VSYFVDLNFCDVIIPGFLAPQGPENIFPRNLSLFFRETCLACSDNVYRGGPLVGVDRKILSVGTKFNQTSMADPSGCCRQEPPPKLKKTSMVDPWGCCRQQPPPKLKKTSMADPWGCYWYLRIPAVATTEVEEDVDGRAPGRCCQQQPPLKLKNTSMADPPEGDASISGSSHHRS
jgi:hypothetical protein